MIIILEEEAFPPKGGGCLRLGQSFQKVCPTPPLLLVETLAVLQLGQAGCWAFWFWPNLQQRELGLDTKKDFLSASVPQPLAPAVGGGRSRREGGRQSAGLEGPGEDGDLGKDSLLSDSSSRPCKELKPSLQFPFDFPALSPPLPPRSALACFDRPPKARQELVRGPWRAGGGWNPPACGSF